MTTQLTSRQARVLEIIREETEARGFPPSVREIAARMGIKNPNGVKCHLDALREKGYIESDKGVSRGIRLTGRASHAGYPVIGEVAAGGPVFAVQEEGERISLDDASGARPGDFLLRVKGESMVGAGINPGDMAVVREDANPVNGGIYVVMAGEDEATVKRYYRDPDGMIRLAPENPDYAELVIDPRETNVRIVGRVVGVLRRY